MIYIGTNSTLVGLVDLTYILIDLFDFVPYSLKQLVVRVLSGKWSMV